MTNEKYNGWTNRETWVVNLHLGEMLQEDTQEFYDEREGDIQVWELADRLESFVEILFEEELDNLSLFLKDLLYLDSVDWMDLAEHYRSECE